MTVITSILGGLGNQMFQYAAGRALSLRLGAELRLDVSWFSSLGMDVTPRRYMLDDAFAVSAAVASPEECTGMKWRNESFPQRFLRQLLRQPRPYADTFVQEPHFAYWPEFDVVTAPTYLFGYWQNERYFTMISDTIRNGFAFPELPLEESRHIGKSIQAAPHAVSIHVRRGDYVTNPQTSLFHGLCSERYYTEALRHLHKVVGKNLDLFVFSDDPVWVKNNFDLQGFPAVFVNVPAHSDAPWHDMHLMSLCRHHIIANSSFSWWGAWLSREQDLVYAPARWFNLEKRVGDSPVPARWTVL